MADVIRIKRRAVGGASGPPSTLAAAELAFNEQDNTLYYGKGNSGGLATTIVPIGGVLGTVTQAQDAELQALAGLASAADQLPYFTGVGAAALTTLSNYIRSLLDDADAVAARSTLGLGTAATQNTGTSGGTVPLLNGANTWSAGQTFSSTTIQNGRQRYPITTGPAIATGSWALPATGVFITVDTEAAAAADDLDTITGGTAGDVITLLGASGARIVTVRHNIGNIRLAGGANFTFTNNLYRLELHFNGTSWAELGRSANS